MTFSWTTFLFEIVNFVVLAYILHRLLYAPLRAAIAKRQEQTKQACAEAAQTHQEAQALQQKLDLQAADLERQREEVLRQARVQAQGEREKLLHAAEQGNQRHLEETRRALQLEREEVFRSLRQEVIDLSVDLSQRLLQQVADSSLDRQLVLRLLDSLNATDTETRARLRRQWHPEDGAVVEVAGTVEPATQQRLNETIANLLGQPVTLTLQTTPEVLGGARLRLGGVVWDATLAGQLQELRRPRTPEEGPCQTSLTS